MIDHTGIGVADVSRSARFYAIWRRCFAATERICTQPARQRATAGFMRLGFPIGPLKAYD
jgi:hypothetical protein